VSQDFQQGAQIGMHAGRFNAA